jgi:hypothetical protein
VAGEPEPARSDLPPDTKQAIRIENAWVDRFKNGQLEAHVTQRFETCEAFEAALAAALVHLDAATRGH